MSFLDFLTMWFLLVVLVVFLLLVLVFVLLISKDTKKRNSHLILSGINIVDTMNGTQFERFLKVHFENLGFRADMTATYGDYGADLILSKEEFKAVVQAKRWNRSVGIEAVQQVIGAVRHYGASRAIVITNSHFTEAAKNLARTNSVELWDREKLITMMSQANGKEYATQILSSKVSTANTRDTCPRCNGTLLKRNGKRGPFLGCSSYPKCRYTRDV